MKQVINTNGEGLPVKMWLDDLESSATEQAKNLARLPFAFKHIAVMPGAHYGYGMPIECILATTGQVIPNAVGVDIGCGMRAVQLPYTEIPDYTTLCDILGAIRRVVPVGFKKHTTRAHGSKMPDSDVILGGVCMQEYSNAARSLGTLGGGNHFIELQWGSDDHLWLMIHSGSRNLGHTVANHYNKVAVRLNEKYASGVPKHYELAHLPIDSEEGRDYITEMNYCIEFAKANRNEMMGRVVNILYDALDMDRALPPSIDIAHNYARFEFHFGRDVMIHRKGATSARNGEFGIIPGSQGTSSYIVRGKGNPESFTSCSHGAGRCMSRSKAKAELNLVEEQLILNRQGIVHSVRTESDLDEAVGSYKDIETVMENQTDLVDIVVELKPLAVVKG